MSASGRTRKRSGADYVFCRHCEEISVKRYKEHERLYFNIETNQWVKDSPITEEADELSESSLSNFDEFEALDDKSFNNSDSQNAEDIMNFTHEEQCHAESALPQLQNHKDLHQGWQGQLFDVVLPWRGGGGLNSYAIQIIICDLAQEKGS